MPYTSGTYSNNETLLYRYLSYYGYNKAVACGVLANILHESSFNPTKVGDRGAAYGICQWRDDRRTNLNNYCRDKHMSVDYIVSQIMFMQYEITEGEESGARKYFSGPDDEHNAHDVGYNIARYYERCSQYPHGDNRDEWISRGNTAIAFYRYYSNNPVQIDIDPDLNLDTSTPPIDTATGGTALSDQYAQQAAENLATVEAAGYDYGYLIDMDHDRTFKFYIPEFTESAGSKYGTVSIPGRSVDVQYYQSTSSRNVTISLDLYAGVGIYTDKTGLDSVSAIHEDANFLKSLEYPDYQNSVARPPSRVHLILGSSINFQGVVTNVQVTHMKPLDTQNRSMYLKVSFTVTQVETNPPDYKDIREGTYTIPSASDPSSMVGKGRN